jgi:hypothetical protein
MKNYAVGSFIPPLQPDGLAEQQTLLASFEL